MGQQILLTKEEIDTIPQETIDRIAKSELEMIKECRYLKEKYKPDEETYNYKWSHGFGNFGRSANRHIKLFKYVMENTSFEICVSNHRMGQIGLFLNGIVTVISTEDLDSYVCQFTTHERVFDFEKYERFLVTNVDESKYFMDNKYLAHKRGNNIRFLEAFMIPNTIIGAWIKKPYIDKLKPMINTMRLNFGIREWNILDQYGLDVDVAKL